MKSAPLATPRVTSSAARAHAAAPTVIIAIAFMVTSIAFILASVADPVRAAESPDSGRAEPVAVASWELSATAYYYFFPHEPDEILPIFYADHGALHLEGRYNYEDTRTASVFAGWTFRLGEDPFLEATPMAGVVLGNTSGLAPGLEFTLGAGPLEIYSESEYVLDSGSRDNDFLYIWTEASVRPVEPLALGIVLQQFKEHGEAVETQAGFLAGLGFRSIDLGVYCLSPFQDDQFFVFALTTYF